MAAAMSDGPAARGESGRRDMEAMQRGCCVNDADIDEMMLASEHEVPKCGPVERCGFGDAPWREAQP